MKALKKATAVNDGCRPHDSQLEVSSKRQMIILKIRHYLEGRLFEWAMAIPMVLLAVEIFVWPLTLEDSAFYWLTAIMPSSYIGTFLLLFGSARCAALVVNGRSHIHGPRVRAIGALAGAVMWAQFDLA